MRGWRYPTYLGVCDGCGAEVSDEELYRCGECGRKYCEECAVADGTIKTNWR